MHFSRPQGRPGYVTGVDGIRALAVIGVIVYHLLPTTLGGGFLGVPLFLLISGYFVTDQLQREWNQTGTIALPTFYHRRFKRLYPTLVAMLVATVAYITLFQRALLHQIRVTVVTNLLWVYNWWEVGHGQSYFDRFAGESPFTHLWTLGVEGQFYLIWPAILFIALVALNRHRSVLKWATFLLALASAIEMAVLYQPANPNRVYYGTDTRAFSLLLGAWLAMVWPRERLRPVLSRRGRQVLNGIGLGSLLLTILSFFLANGQAKGTYYGGMFLASLAGMFLLATVVHPGSNMNAWLTNPVFTWLGKRSYGIYVYQLPVMVFYEHLVPIGRHPFLNALVQCGLILVISELSYRLVERPLAHYDWRTLPQTVRSWFSRQQSGWRTKLTVAPLTVLCLIALVGLSLPDHAPKKTAVQQRISKAGQAAAKRNRMLAAGKTPAVQADAHSLKQKYQLSTNQVTALKKIKVTAVGDSVMADASQDIQELMPQAYVDAQVGRQGSAAPAVLRDLKAKGQLNKIVVLNLGTNGAMSTATIQEILETIGSRRQVYWITAHAPTMEWEGTVNAQIKQAVKDHKNVHLVDWNAQSKDHANWFAGDRVHMDGEGNAQFTRLIAVTILKTEGKQ